ncbi:MAG TPA: MFS transporter [Kofleriaceae bacterium]|nr:MFS transporter [Kofleriaceae bacterium]
MSAVRTALPRAVIALGAVSLLTDVSTEMIYPLLPVFVAGAVGGGALSLGLIEGVAESTASLVKLASGALSDRMPRRKPLLVIGYGLAGLARPLIGLARIWPVVLLLRFADRIGKGLRGPPRDALIADAVSEDARGRAFGLHQAMDHAGAVIGPLCAAGLLALGMEMRGVFLAAAVPAAAVMIVLWIAVKESPRALPVATSPSAAPPSAAKPVAAPLGADFRRLVAAVVLFTLGNSTDAFLLLRLNQAGLGAELLALLWSAHHVIKMAASYLGGRASDRWSRRPLLIAAWLMYGAVYLLFALLSSRTALVATFLAYGLTLGLAEPVEKAWTTDLVPRERRGAAFGWLAGATGLVALPASLLFGLVWRWQGHAAAFGLGAGLAAAAALALCRVGRAE